MTSNPLHSRIDLACEQLDVAIELFLEGNSFVSALTLAGAAEEVLGIEAKNRGETNELQRRLEERTRLLPSVGMAPPSRDAFFKHENYARNAAKHIVDKERPKEAYDEFLRGDLAEAATKMIFRALKNAALLSLPESELAGRFRSWYLGLLTSHEEP